MASAVRITFRQVALICAFVAVSGGSVAWGQTTVFTGRPHVKVSEGGNERLPERVSPSTAVNLECVISEIDGKFYWASRKNAPLMRIDGRCQSAWCFSW